MQKVGLKPWVAKLLAPALSVALVLAASPYAVAQSAFNPDPAQKWVGWQGGSAAVTTPQLRDGNVYKLNPAEIIYYAALENRVNPLLLLVKLQEEQSLIGQTYAGAALQHKLDRAVGYGVLESDPSTTKWFGFYPQLVGMSYEFSVMGKKKDFHAAFLEYTPHEDKYAALQTRYAQYAQVLNRAAGKNYAAMPTSAGYMGDFRDVLPQHIQAFLDNYPTNLKDRNLFSGSGGGGNPGVGVGNGAKIINQSAIPTQMQKDQPLRFTVQTDKPAEQVKITFQNPAGEALLTGSGTQWSLDRVVTAAGVRPWVISVITAGKVTDDHLKGTLTVGQLDDFMLMPKIVGGIEAPARVSVNDEMKVRLRTNTRAEQVVIDFGNNTVFPLTPDATYTTWLWNKQMTQVGQRDYFIKVFSQNNKTQASDQKAGSVLVEGGSVGNVVHPLPSHPIARVLADAGYGYVFKSEHTGVDVMAPVGTGVKAMCDGVVAGNYTSKAVVNAFLIVRHSCAGQQLYGYYGHIASSLGSGVAVKAGDVVGTVRQYGSNNHHLHFGVNVSLLSKGWGRASLGTSRQAMLNAGWLDPIEFLQGKAGATAARVNPFEIPQQERVSREQFGVSVLDASPSIGQRFTGSAEQRLRSAGLIQTELKGAEPIIRADAVRMAYRLLANHGNLSQLLADKRLDRFNLDEDLEEDSALREQANALAALGLVSGIQNGTIHELEPARQLSRGEQGSIVEKMRGLLGGGGQVGSGAKVINQSAIPTQMQKDQPLRFTVQTDKPAEQVKITFQNPVGEALLTGSGTQWSLDRVVTAVGVRPWVISVITAGKVTDDHLRGSLTVMGVDMPLPAPQLPVTPVTPVRPITPVQPVQPLPVLPTITAMNNAVSTAQLRVRQKAEFTLSGVNLASTVLVSFTNCDQPVTKFVNVQTMTHECVPRTQGDQRLFWKNNAADVERNIKSFAIAPEILPPQPKGDSLETFINRWLGHPVDFDRSYGFQCVDLMRRYAVDVLDLNSSLPRGNAYDIFANTNSANFTKVVNSPSAVPKRGDIIFWNKLPSNGNAGHVAIFLEGDANQFTSFDQNYCSSSGSGKGECAPRKAPHNYAGVVGWLSPKSNTQPSPPSLPPLVPVVAVPAPPVVTDGMGFVGETVPDKTVVNAGTQFNKSWTLRNTGTSTWDSNYCLRPVSGDVLGHSAICVNGTIAPGASYAFATTMLAPAAKAADSEHTQVWALSKVNQAKIGTQVTVQIKVPGQARPVPAPVPAPVAPAPQPSRPPIALPVVPVAPAPQPSRPPVALPVVPVAPVAKPMQITSLVVPQKATHLHALSVAVFANQTIGSATFEFTDGRGANMVAKNSSYAMQCIGSSCTVTTAQLNAKYVSGARPWRVTVNNGSGSDNKTGSVNVTQ